MAFVQNFPFFCIIMTLFSGPLSSILGGKAARRLNLADHTCRCNEYGGVCI